MRADVMHALSSEDEFDTLPPALKRKVCLDSKHCFLCPSIPDLDP